MFGYLYSTLYVFLTIVSLGRWLQFAAETCGSNEKQIVHFVGDRICVTESCFCLNVLQGEFLGCLHNLLYFKSNN